MLSRPKVEAIAAALTNLPAGDLAEFGVYRGGVARMLAETGRRVWLFDTFDGLPATAKPETDWHKPGEFACPIADLLDYLHPFKPELVVGIFPESARGIEARFALVHIDADLFQSTLDGLRWFWARLKRGGLMFLDDWGWKFCRGVKLAVAEWLTQDRPTNYAISVSAANQLRIEKL